MGLIEARPESIPESAIVGRRKKGGGSNTIISGEATPKKKLIAAAVIGMYKLIGVDVDGKAVLATKAGVPAIAISLNSCQIGDECYYDTEGEYNIYDENEATGPVELGTAGNVGRAVDYADTEYYQEIGTHTGEGNVLLSIKQAVYVSIPS